MKPFYEVVRRPLITEKSVLLKEQFGRYAFEVFPEATKPLIREAIEGHFQVKVREVRTMIVRGKSRRIGRHSGRRANWKKAIVTLAKGQKLELFEVK